MDSERNEELLSAKKSIAIHREDNLVYFHSDVGFYTVEWYNEGNSEIPYIRPINLKKD